MSRAEVSQTDADVEPHDTPVEAYYMGCHEQAGHYFWTPGMRQVSYADPPTPWGYGLDSPTFDTKTWHVEKKDGWTAVGLEDRSVDSRPGSHSVFAFHADLTLDEAVALARSTFPEVFARDGFPRVG